MLMDLARKVARAVPLSSRQRGRLASRLMWPRLVGLREPHPARPILLCGTQRSGTTWAAEALAAGADGRIIFEPFGSGRSYPRLVTLRRHSLVSWSSDVQDSLLWLLYQRLPYNHHADRLAKRREYRTRIIKDLNINFCIPNLADVAPRLPIVYIMRHPYSSILSHINLSPNKYHQKAERRVRHLLDDRQLREAIPLPAEIPFDPKDPIEAELLYWGIHSYPLRTLLASERYLIIRYEDILADGQRVLERIASYLQAYRIGFDTSQVNLLAPSKTVLAGKRSKGTWQKSEYRDLFASDDNRAKARRIFGALGLVEPATGTVFGYEI